MNILVTTKIANTITMQPFGTEISELNENGLNMGIKNAINYFGGNAIGVVPFGDQTKVEAYNEADFYGDKLFQRFSQEEIEKETYLVKNSDGLVLPGGLETRPYELLLARFHPETIFRQIANIKEQGGNQQEIDAIIEDNKPSFMMFGVFARACAKISDLNASSVDINDPQFSNMIYPDLEKMSYEDSENIFKI